MLKSVFFFLCYICCICFTFAHVPNVKKNNFSEISLTTTINLRPNNFVVLRGPIDSTKASVVINELVSMKAKEIYLYLDSPGGSVLAGLQIIQAMQSMQNSGVKVHTIANNVASMAFVIHQFGQNRYVRPWSILMQHQMSYGSEGQYYNVKAHEELMDKMYKQLMTKQADRIGMSCNEFNDRTRHDMWLLGDESIKQNFADKIVDVVCDFEPETFEESFKIFWFDVKTVYSTCPLANKPLSIEINGNATSNEYEDIYKMFDQEYLFFKSNNKIN